MNMLMERHLWPYGGVKGRKDGLGLYPFDLERL